jgi:tetratricopeptide (TPR) repeat protein
MRTPHRLLGVGLTLGLAAYPAVGADVKDLYFGEALFHAYQGQYFEALERLDAELAQYHGLDEPVLDTLHYHINGAEFSVGDFELNYRMHRRAGRAIKAVLDGAVDDAVRNEAAFRLARIHFQKGQLDDAQHALARIEGAVPEAIKDDVELLRANIYMATGRPGEAAEVLRKLRSDRGPAGFAAYNLGIALLQEGRSQDAIEQLDKAGQIKASDRADLAIRDKSNLVLATLLFEAASPEKAKQSLDRVRLDGPFSNQALLRAGWAEAVSEHYDRALVPWNILVDREPTDAAVQEAMLAGSARVRQPERARPRRDSCTGARSSSTPPRSKGRRVDRQHQEGTVSRRAGPRGVAPGQGLCHPPAQPCPTRRKPTT